MIDSIRLVNFKGHKNSVIPLQQMTVLVGPNSSGKTSVLQALECISLLRQQTPGDIFVGRKEPINLTRKGESFFLLELGGEKDESWTFSVKLSLSTSTQNDNRSFAWSRGKEQKSFSLSSSLETMTSQDYFLENEDGEFAEDENGIPLSKAKLPKVVYDDLKHAVFLKFNAHNLASPSYALESVSLVQSNGRGLASAIAHLKLYEDETFEKLEEAVRKVVPQVRRIRVRRAKISFKENRTMRLDATTIPYQDKREIWGDELVLDMVGAKGVPAHAVSEGTLFAVGLLTVLVNPNCPKLILLDDIEQTLHPKAQRELVHVLKGLLEENEDLQIVMTTHSPYIVDELESSSVCVMATDQNGVVVARCLDEHPDAERALEVLTTGEFLSAEGEEWVLQSENAND